MKKYILYIFTTISISCYAQVPFSGYSSTQLIIFRDQNTKTINGYFNSSTASGQFNCVYEFKGSYNTLNDHVIKIFAFWPNDKNKIEGELICKSENLFILKFNDFLPGDMACEGASQDGAEFELVENKKWLDIKMIKVSKAYFYNDPSEKNRRKAYITQYDPVAILQKKGNWFLAEYYGEKLTTGWIKSTDVYE